MARLPRAFTPDLTVAMRRARLEDAERSQTASDIRAGEIARLEQLRVALEPVFSQTGLHAGAFDHGLVPGETPKLFVDIIAWIDCGRDRKSYRFVQDSRRGPVTLAESDRLDPILEAVTMYVARRIVEREKAMASTEIPPAPVAARVAPPPPAKTGFGDLLLLVIVGALVGGAAVYAWLRLSLI